MTDDKKKIMVVEDETALQKVLVEWLKTEGFDVAAASTGLEAVKMIPEELPDLILLDIILPEMDGFEVMRELAKNPATASIPIIILSNLGDEENRNLALQLGAKSFLVKAEYDLPGVKKKIQEVIG